MSTNDEEARKSAKLFELESYCEEFLALTERILDRGEDAVMSEAEHEELVILRAKFSQRG